MPKVAENGPVPFLAQSVVPKVAENGPVPFLAQSVVNSHVQVCRNNVGGNLEVS